jgi:ParB family chromosome partitioning protein
MAELDEKYADVIVKRYIEQAGSDEGVFLLRNNERFAYKDAINLDLPVFISDV